MRLRPVEHLENSQPKCKIHTQERQLTRFFCILQLIYKENRIDRFFRTETEPNLRFFSKKQNRAETETSLKNPFRTSLLTTALHLYTVWVSDTVTHWATFRLVSWHLIIVPFILNQSLVTAISRFPQQCTHYDSHLADIFQSENQQDWSLITTSLSRDCGME